MDDETEKKSLPAFAYDQLFTKKFRKSKKLEHLTLKDGRINFGPAAN
jgi:hypothetical protein